jgi:hypothetical protein
MKADAPFILIWRRFDEELDSFEDGLDLLTLLFLPPVQIFELLGKLLVCCKQMAQPDERSHDGDVYLNRPGTGKDG